MKYRAGSTGSRQSSSSSTPSKRYEPGIALVVHKGARESYTVYDEVQWEEIPPPRDLEWLPPQGFRWMDDADWVSDHSHSPKSRHIFNLVMLVVVGVVLVLLACAGVVLWYVMHSR